MAYRRLLLPLTGTAEGSSFVIVGQEPARAEDRPRTAYLVAASGLGRMLATESARGRPAPHERRRRDLWDPDSALGEPRRQTGVQAGRLPRDERARFDGGRALGG